MRLWAVEASGHYCGGCAVIAADSEDEARELARHVPRDPTWSSLRWDAPESVALLDCEVSGAARLVYNYAMGE